MYKLQENKVITAISNFRGSLESGTSFVAFGAVTGAMWGYIASLPPVETTKQVIEAGDGMLLVPLFVTCATAYQAKKMFDNIKKDFKRYKNLSYEARKQQIIDNYIKENNLSHERHNSRADKIVTGVQLYDLREDFQDNSQTRGTDSKRLSLNNGIYKSNDNYTAS